VQVNADLFAAFAGVLSEAIWDVALLQECPPRWAQPLASACDATGHRVLTSRNSFGHLRTAAALLNPDLIGSNAGGSTLTLVRGGRISERRSLELGPGPRPERRAMAFTRIAGPASGELCIANLHASAGAALLAQAEAEVMLAAERAIEWARGAPLLLGGDLNLRPRESGVYRRLEELGLHGPAAPDSLDHLLGHGLATVRGPSAWPAERREVRSRGLAIRLSDHAPVDAVFE
jgi:endonuclease/exonuclease/phosphatase family metal-dependent hydrolase